MENTETVQRNTKDSSLLSQELEPKLNKSLDTSMIRRQITKKTRFYRKVLLWLTIQYVIIASIITIAILVEDFKILIVENSVAFYIILSSWIFNLFILSICQASGRTFPFNYIQFFTFTIMLGWIATYFLQCFEAFNVISIPLTLGSTTFILALFSFWTSTFTRCKAMFFLLIITLLATGTLILIFPENALNLVFNAFVLLTYSLYLIYDIQVIVSSGRYNIDYTHYLVACLLLWVDVFNVLIQCCRKTFEGKTKRNQHLQEEYEEEKQKKSYKKLSNEFQEV